MTREELRESFAKEIKENTVSPSTAQNEKADPQPSHKPEIVVNPADAAAVKVPDDNPKKDVVSRLMQYYSDHQDDFADDVSSLDAMNGYVGDHHIHQMSELESSGKLVARGGDDYGDTAFNPNRKYYYFNGNGEAVSTDDRSFLTDCLNYYTVRDIAYYAADLHLSKGAQEIIGIQPSHEPEKVVNPANVNAENKPNKKPDDKAEKVVKENIKTEQKVDDDDVTVEFENMILYITRTDIGSENVDYYINDKETGCLGDCGSWFDDCNVTADLKEAVKSIIKDKDITEQILSVNEGDRFEEIAGISPVRQRGGQSL